MIKEYKERVQKHLCLIMFIFSDFSQIFAFPCKKMLFILFIIFGHLMPLFNTNSREITGNAGEREREGTYMQKKFPGCL